MTIDFTAPAFFDVVRATRSHTASAYLVTLAALSQGLSVTFFRSQREAGLKNPLFADEVTEATFYRVSNGRRAHYFAGTQCDRTSAAAAVTTKDKVKTKALLHAKNLNTPVGGVMSAQDYGLLGRLHHAGVKWFVIKPLAGSLGEGVFPHQTAAQVLRYLQANPKDRFLVEQHITGFEHRVYVVNGEVVSAYRRMPNHVVGNGTDSVKTLFTARQEHRKSNPNLVDKPADMAEVEMALVARGGAWSDVPLPCQIVWLASYAMPSAQGDYILSLDELSDSAKQLAVDAAKVVAAYNVGIDMIVEPSGEAYVLEINIRAWISAHCFPFPKGDYNLTLPTALIESLFGPPKTVPRALFGFDFTALGAEVLREGRTSSGVDASDYAHFG